MENMTQEQRDQEQREKEAVKKIMEILDGWSVMDAALLMLKVKEEMNNHSFIVLSSKQ